MNTEQQIIPHIVPPKTIKSAEDLAQFTNELKHSPLTNDETARQLKDAHARISERRVLEPARHNDEPSQINSVPGNTVKGDQVVMSAVRQIAESRGLDHPTSAKAKMYLKL